jgi:cell division transport system ATP-binding protein
MSLDTVITVEKASIYQADHLVLSSIDANIQKGDFIYLIGKTGSGKSSFLKTLYGELPLKEGNISIAGFELSKLKRKKLPYLRRKLGIVFQDYQLLPDRNLYKNLEFVLKATGWKKKTDIEQRIQDVLDKVGLEHKEYKMPHELSGGEQQRVVIARALLNDPEIILADEPTGNLDPNSSSEIIKLLSDISNNGRAVIIATHDLPLMQKYPGRILQCEKGKLQLFEANDTESTIYEN